MTTTVEVEQAPATGARRNEKVGEVVSTKMQKTIVVEVEMRKAHPKYKRIVRTTKRFYAHDELSSARMGDVVRIRETRPLSKLKRWALEEIVRRSSLGQIEDAAAAVNIAETSLLAQTTAQGENYLKLAGAGVVGHREHGSHLHSHGFFSSVASSQFTVLSSQFSARIKFNFSDFNGLVTDN